ncbi:MULTISPECIES: DUF3307 domain-containing protein [unclassified Roseovarius]|uniref:DUF3307 domain-containing protein n=1 Tax=unclassified Roseovarius TaxID=2614913 RepID=UPI00006855F7|nr:MULTISPECIES: DUF3307 domain-containing protein [unclassified Roseovarius]EAQ24429.1 hypothetical protein ROS217_09265 [Roseovarius sp. 217]KJS41539.1 MAG: hypothetical protein VR71_17975 [Roseovarius sp. BRH_c41]
MTSIFNLSLFLILFQIKHYLADFQLQTGWMAANKGRYGHPSGVLHAGLHGAFSLPILLWFGLTWKFSLGLAIAETVLHYHIDWAKSRAVRQNGVDDADPRFWHYLGLDQAAHQLTYVALFAIVASRAA